MTYDYDEEFGPLATPRDAMREYADWVGAESPDVPWILTDYDVWVPNPHYHGPAVPHPEEAVDYPDDYLCEDEEA